METITKECQNKPSVRLHGAGDGTAVEPMVCEHGAWAQSPTP